MGFFCQIFFFMVTEEIKEFVVNIPPEKWKRLIALLPELKKVQPAYKSMLTSGYWVREKGQAPSEAEKLFDLLIKSFTVMFDWMHWDKGHKAIQRQIKFEELSLEECVMLLSMIVRSDRYNVGFYAKTIHDGTMVNILQRIARLKQIIV